MILFCEMVHAAAPLAPAHVFDHTSFDVCKPVFCEAGSNWNAPVCCSLPGIVVSHKRIQTTVPQAPSSKNDPFPIYGSPSALFRIELKGMTLIHGKIPRALRLHASASGKAANASSIETIGRPALIHPGPRREPSMPSETLMKLSWPASRKARVTNPDRLPVAQIRAMGRCSASSRATPRRLGNRVVCMLTGQAPRATPVSCHSPCVRISSSLIRSSSSAAWACCTDQMSRLCARATVAIGRAGKAANRVRNCRRLRLIQLSSQVLLSRNTYRLPKRFTYLPGNRGQVLFSTAAMDATG